MVADAREVRDELILDHFKAEGILAWTASIAEAVSNFDDTLVRAAGGNPRKAAIMSALEATAVAKVQRIQRGLLSDWEIN